jgi:hypothetical protein
MHFRRAEVGEATPERMGTMYPVMLTIKSLLQAVLPSEGKAVQLVEVGLQNQESGVFKVMDETFGPLFDEGKVFVLKGIC